jgi:Domain of unknown function (DUF6249)
MDPSSVINSFTGVVAVIMIFGIPIVTTALIAAVILSVAGKRHKERMKMIEQGMVPPPPRKQRGNYYGLLIAGAIVFAFGLALLAGDLATRGGDPEGGLIFSFVGAAMLITFAIIRAYRKKEPTTPEPGKEITQDPPHPLP